MSRAHNFSAGPAVLPLSVIEQLAAALPDSFARKALVTAILILSSSNETTFPFLLITRSFPGAVMFKSSEGIDPAVSFPGPSSVLPNSCNDMFYLYLLVSFVGRLETIYQWVGLKLLLS